MKQFCASPTNRPMTKNSTPAPDSNEPVPPGTNENAPADGGVVDALPRREFLRVAGGSAGLFMAGAAGFPLKADMPSVKAKLKARATGRSSDIIVIGAGGWGSFTALNLVMRGHKVTLVDAYGPGNARSTSGDESRGVRSSYGDRPGVQGEVWTLWARDAMNKWKAFDEEWGKHFRLDLFHVTGDLIMRNEWDNFQLRTKVWWDKHKIPYEILSPSDVRKSFPVMSIDDITAMLYEPGHAGVVRARRAAQAAANAFEALGRQASSSAAPCRRRANAAGRVGLHFARHRRNSPGGHLCVLRRCVDGENISRVAREKDARADGLRLLLRHARQRRALHLSESPELQLSGRHGMGCAAGGQPRVPCARDRASAGRTGRARWSNAARGPGRSGGRGSPVAQRLVSGGGAGIAGGGSAGGGGGGRGQGGFGNQADVPHRRSSIRISATAGPMHRASTARDGSLPTDSRCSRTRRSTRHTPATTSRRRAETISSTSIRSCPTPGSSRAGTPRDSRCAR